MKDENQLLELYYFYAESVQLVEMEETLWSIKANLVIPVEKFSCGQVAEFLLHMMIKGKSDKSYPSDLVDYLGVGNDFLAEYQNYDLLSGAWPFSNTLVNAQNCIEAEYPDELKELLHVISGLELTDNRFLAFAEKRKSFSELPESYRNSRNFRSVFDELANELLDLILYVQKSKTSDSKWGDITLEMLVLEKIDYARKVRHYNANDFIELLAFPEVFGKRMPAFPHTKELENIFNGLREEVNRFTGFRSVLKSKLEDKIKTDNCPLRFSYGRLHEIYVHCDLQDFPPVESSLKTLDRALIDANKFRPTKCTIPLRNIVGSCKQFLEQNNFASVAEVAATVQDIFDFQRIKTTRKIPNGLKTQLEDLIGISNGKWL